MANGKRGAPLGNQNSRKAKVWSAAIERALAKRGGVGKALDELADKLLDMCKAGDLGAMKELGDRLEGKVAQAVTIGTGDEGFVLTLKTSAADLVQKIRGTDQ